MKKILSLIVVALLVVTAGYSQSPSPGIFNYQGVARNSVGNALINQTITLRLTIHDGSAGGTSVYQESRTTTTNPFGLFNVQVGGPGATNVTGTISGVSWGVNAKFIQVEIDPLGGSTFINIGTAQIASVPYSLYSSLSNDLVLPFNKTQANAGTLFTITNSGTSISGAIMGVTQSNAANAWGVQGRVDNPSAGGFSAGVLGTNLSTTAFGIGVMGTQSGGGWGVYGNTPTGIGVFGNSLAGSGIYGSSVSGTGVFGTSNTGNSGVFANTNSGNPADALQASTNGTGSSWALRATSTGAQGAGIFTYNNAAGTANTIRSTNNGSGAGISVTATGTGSAGLFSNTNAANPVSTVAISTNSTNATALSLSGPGIWGSAMGITNTTSGMEWRTSVNNTTYTVTKIPGATFSPFLLFSDGQVEFPSTTSANRLRILDNGNVGVGTAFPTTRFHVAGTVRIQDGTEGLNKVLTSDASGNATWQPAAGGVSGSGTVNFVPKWTPTTTSLGNSQIFDNGTSVGINTATPNAAYRLEVNGIQRIDLTSVQEGGELRFQEGTLFGASNHWIIDNFESNAGGNKFRLWNDVGGMNIQMMPGGKTAIGPMVFSDQPQSMLDIEGNLAVGATYSGTTAAPVNGAIIEGNVGIGTNNPTSKLEVIHTGTTSALRIDLNNPGGGGLGINLTTNSGGNGISSINSGSTPLLGRAGFFQLNNAASSAEVVAVRNAGSGDGVNSSTTGTGWAANFSSSNATPKALKTAGGVQLTGLNETNNYVLTCDALGNALWKPLPFIGGRADHNFVESHDMMSIYNGNIATDALGKAIVQLPDYFDASNREFRYQLTVMGSFAQAIISKEVSNNKFEIATSQPNIKVSWQVTGIRHDALAEKK